MDINTNSKSSHCLTLHLLIFFFFVSPYLEITKFCLGDENLNVKCIRAEREALVAFKNDLKDPSARLAAWVGEECCKWNGIKCNSQTGHVTKLNLRNPFQLINGGVGDPTAYKTSCISGKINPSLLHLEKLDYLDLSFNDFEGIPIPEFFGQFNNLKYLAGEIPPHLGNLSLLYYLDLYADSFSASGAPELYASDINWLSGLSSLRYLNMGVVKLNRVGDVWLQAINMLPSLVELHLYWCELQGLPLSLPFINFTALSVLDLSENSFNSLIPKWLFNLTSLTKLYLQWDFFTGSIPVEFAKLKSLETLDLSSNLNLEGQIPGLFGNLSRLKILDLSANNFDSEIDEFLGGFSGNPESKIVSLYVTSNSLTGELPESLGLLKNLQHLHLSGNSFWGSIPGSIGNLSSLKKFDISYNKMNGTIPLSFGKLSELVDVNLMENSWQGVLREAHLINLTKLEHIRLTTDSAKSLIFNLSYKWVPSFQLKSIQLENCLIGPMFPKWLQVQTELESIIIRNAAISDKVPSDWFSKVSSQVTYLILSNNQFKGKLPNQLESPSMNVIDLSLNQFEGSLPIWSTNASELLLHGNSFSGTIPENIGVLMPKLQKLYLSWNRLDGQIPSSICDMESLQILSLRNNFFTGNLPDCWYHLHMLWGVDASNNSLTGKIPSSFGYLNSLSILMLSNNNLDGEVPSSLQNCSGLTSINLGGNKLSGTLPLWIGERLSSLFMLRLRSNMFNGQILKQLCNLQNLRLLDLSYNNLSGQIPACLGNLPALVYLNGSDIFEKLIFAVLKGREPEYSSIIADIDSINLSGNNLTGGIPNEITYLSYLKIMNLSMNNLSRRIPENIGNMRRLELLDLSHNHISGPIPESLVSLDSLAYLNLSYNNLVGRIPQFPKFNDSSIYEHNPRLCGVPLPRNCSSDE